MLTFSEIERVLVVMAHPDDVDFGSCGTVCALRAAGVEVSYCLVTSGDAGGDDRAMNRDDMVAMRIREQTTAAGHAGVTDLEFLGYPDGRVEATLDLRRDISRVIRERRPDVVICQSPERNLDRLFASHPDHMAAAEAAMCAVYPDARNPFAFPELLEAGLEPWIVREVWLQGHPRPTDAVDVTDHVDTKMTALMAHASQHPDPEATQHRVRQWMEHTATSMGLGEGRSAEAYRVVVAG